MTEEKHDQLVVESAKVLLPFIASLDPLWKDEIEVMQAERGFDALQTIGALCGYTLEQQAHMWIPQHPFFQDTHIPAGGRRPCPQCGQEWIVAYPGQPVCSNACAIAYYAPPKEESHEEAPKEEAEPEVAAPKVRKGRPASSLD